ncbi:MAG: hypothetical protein ABIE55_04650 [Candidatus Aenigmatarchaeota archaeon]
MLKEDKIRFLKMAISCLRKGDDKRPIFSPDVPTDEDVEIIKKSLETGNIEENMLKRFFPIAYKGVSEYGFFEYFFSIHNMNIGMLEKYTKDKLVDWCTAFPGKIVDRKESKWVVERYDGKRIISDSEAYPGITIEKELKIGDFVILHRDKIHMVLNKDEFETALKFYNKFRNEK